MRYQVFIEGSRDPSPLGQQRLASTLGQRYGLSPPLIAQRLGQGPFCAWAAVDGPTAERLRRELEAAGAHVRVVAEEANWEVSNIDGTEVEAPPTRPAAPPVGRPTARSTPPPPTPSGTADPFAPPDSAFEVQQLELEAAARPARPSPPAARSPASASIPPASPGAPVPVRGGTTVHREPLLARLREQMAESTRARFFAAVLVAFVLGLVPAEIYAAWRRGSAYDDIRADLQADYAKADTPEGWSALGGTLADARALAGARQQRIAVTACLVWLLVGGAAGFTWWRVIDWQGARPRIAPAQGSAAGAAARRRVTR